MIFPIATLADDRLLSRNQPQSEPPLLAFSNDLLVLHPEERQDAPKICDASLFQETPPAMAMPAG
jgi:hypothetical protein